MTVHDDALQIGGAHGLDLDRAFDGRLEQLLQAVLAQQAPAAGLRNFRLQHEEEWPFMYEYLDSWHAVRSMLRALPCDPELEARGMFFFYWAGRKRA